MRSGELVELTLALSWGTYEKIWLFVRKEIRRHIEHQDRRETQDNIDKAS